MFDGDLRQFIQRGDKNKIFVDNNGLEVFKRIKALEDSGKIMDDALNIVKQEISHQPEMTTTRHNNDSGKLVETLENQIEFLISQMNIKDREISRLQEVIETRLPALPAGQNGQQPSTSRWAKLKQFIKGQ